MLTDERFAGGVADVEEVIGCEVGEIGSLGAAPDGGRPPKRLAKSAMRRDWSAKPAPPYRWGDGRYFLVVSRLCTLTADARLGVLRLAPRDPASLFRRSPP